MSKKNRLKTLKKEIKSRKTKISKHKGKINAARKAMKKIAK